MNNVHVFLMLYCWIHCVYSVCLQNKNCVLPNCQCLQKKVPAGLSPNEIPQIVLFTFDDAVRSRELSYYNRLFPSNRQNPNGCPITMTVFLQDNNTEYGAVRELYQRGMEVAVHSISHRTPQSFWKHISEAELLEEIYGQKLNIHQEANIPLDKIRGWRSPFLQPSGDKQYKILANQSYGFTYDSSLTAERRHLTELSVWPYTLDFGGGVSCGTPPCPKKRYPGLWEFPVIPMIDNSDYPRIYVDSSRPQTANDSYRYLMRNFESHYSGSRSPFLINMHAAAWFAYPHNLDAMDNFIEHILAKDDVYVITIQQALSWLKSPVRLSAVKDFTPWSCQDPFVRQSQDSSKPNRITFPPKSTPRKEKQGSHCVQDKNCVLPSCRCANSGNPGNIPNKNIPQIVLFTFDGPINELNIDIYNKLFPKWRENPNGSPVTMTTFLSHASTDYSLVKELYSRGMEVAVHSSLQNSSSAFWREALASDLEREILTQRRRINQLADIPFKHIQGWRTPFFQPSGDRLFSVLEHNEFSYDSTLTTSRDSLNDETGWPFTLDFGWTQQCKKEPCPKDKYPGLWVIPVVSMVNHLTGIPCHYVHACSPANKSATVDYLWQNFYRHYNTNRAPFMLNMHSSWFQLNPEYFDAVNEFIDDLTRKNDVYIVTIQQAIQWLQSPTELSEIRLFSPWGKQERNVESKDSDNAESTDEKLDWIVIVLVVIASVFGTCMIIIVCLQIVRKYQLQKRNSSIREAMTVTSDRNSVTDWLNAFPRRFSQVSCPTVDTFENQRRDYEYDNVNFELEEDKESCTDSPVKIQLSPANSLTLNPELLKTNYTRDMAIWSKQERKIPHIVNKSQKRRSYGGSELCLQTAHSFTDDSKSKKIKNNDKIDSRKPWTFLWDPSKTLTHSEPGWKPSRQRKKDSDSRCNRTPSDRFGEGRVGRTDRVRHSGRYDFYNSDENTDCSESECESPARYKRQSSEIESEASTCITMLDKAIESELMDVRDTKPYRRDKRYVNPGAGNRYAKTKSNNQRPRPRSTSEEHIRDLASPRRSKSFRYNSDQREKNRAEFSETVNEKNNKTGDRKSQRHSSDLSDKRARYLRELKPERDRQDPRVSKDMEAEWERELRKQFDKFLKSKHALKGLDRYS